MEKIECKENALQKYNALSVPIHMRRNNDFCFTNSTEGDPWLQIGARTSHWRMSEFWKQKI